MLIAERHHVKRRREYLSPELGESHPCLSAVLEAGVIPVPDEKWGKCPKALVVLKTECRRHGGRLMSSAVRTSHLQVPAFPSNSS